MTLSYISLIIVRFRSQSHQVLILFGTVWNYLMVVDTPPIHVET